MEALLQRGALLGAEWGMEGLLVFRCVALHVSWDWGFEVVLYGVVSAMRTCCFRHSQLCQTSLAICPAVAGTTVEIYGFSLGLALQSLPPTCCPLGRAWRWASPLCSKRGCSTPCPELGCSGGSHLAPYGPEQPGGGLSPAVSNRESFEKRGFATTRRSSGGIWQWLCKRGRDCCAHPVP